MSIDEACVVPWNRSRAKCQSTAEVFKEQKRAYHAQAHDTNTQEEQVQRKNEVNNKRGAPSPLTLTLT